MRNINIHLCLKELYTYSKSSLHSLILPAMKYTDNCHVCIILKSKMKPVFNTYFFHFYKSITFVYYLLAHNIFFGGGFLMIRESFGYLQPPIGTLMFCIVFAKRMQVGAVSLLQNRFSKNNFSDLFQYPDTRT